MTIRITGLNSGLDTEALVSELVSAYRTKTQKYTKAQTKLSWKQDAWKSLNTKVTSFYNKLSSFRYSAAYNIRSTTVSDSTKASVSVASSAINGTYSLKIIDIARSGYLTGGELGSSTTGSSKLSDLGYNTAENGTISVEVGGKTTDISVNKDTTIDEFVKSLNDAGVKANYDTANHRIFVAASSAGKENDFSLTGSDANGASALAKLGLSTNDSNAANATYAKWAAYSSYVQYDADGNYDTTAISDLLTSIQSAPTTITNLNAKIEYANAYQSVNDVDTVLRNNAQLATATDAEKERAVQDLKTLIGMSDLTNVYIDSAGNLYDKQETKDDAGNITAVTYVNRNTQSPYEGDVSDLQDAQQRLITLEKQAGLATETTTDTGATVTTPDTAKINAYVSNMHTIAAYEADNANRLDYEAVQDAYASGTLNSTDTTVEGMAKWQNEITAQKELIANNTLLDGYTPDDAEAILDKISNAVGVLNGSITVPTSAGATRVNGQDAKIEINGATYTSTSNQITVNGMTVTALAETKDDEEITVTVANNTQGLYDKIKDLLKEYNTLINEMTSLYNADSAKGYEPLTDEEKDSLTDTEIEKWEEKIKGSLLRRDDTLSSLMSSMTNAMLKSYTINGKSYSLSSFGIHTLGILNASDNEENAFHIDGDADDSATSGNADKLMAALNEDPDSVVEFMKKMTSSLYDSLNKKMSSTTLSSFNVVYNDKEMAREYSDYTTTISKWEEKLEDMEDSYYKKFAAMESALATLQSQQSSFASMLG